MFAMALLHQRPTVGVSDDCLKSKTIRCGWVELGVVGRDNLLQLAFGNIHKERT